MRRRASAVDDVLEPNGRVALGDVVELGFQLCDRASVDARVVAHVVVHHDRQHVRRARRPRRTRSRRRARPASARALAATHRQGGCTFAAPAPRARAGGDADATRGARPRGSRAAPRPARGRAACAAASRAGTRACGRAAPSAARRGRPPPRARALRPTRRATPRVRAARPAPFARGGRQLLQQPRGFLVSSSCARVVVHAQQVVETVPARDREAASGSQEPRRLGEEAVVVGQVLDQAHRRDGVELAGRQARLVVAPAVCHSIASVARIGLDSSIIPGALSTPAALQPRFAAWMQSWPPPQPRSTSREPLLHRGRARPRSPGARARSRRGNANVGVVCRLDPLVGVPVEVVPHIVLHGAKLASPR